MSADAGKDFRSDLNQSLAKDGIEILGPVPAPFDSILTPDALRFVAKLFKTFNPTREKLLQNRIERQKRINAGEMPNFLPETASIRQGDWKISPEPQDLQDRRVEITGPVERKMIINAFNSGASVFMADFEDAHAPVWTATLQGQINLCDAVRRTIEFTNPEGVKYKLNPKVATLMVRPRGWHLPEKHMKVDGKLMSGSMFDFGLFLFHNAKEQIARGTGPYFYLPKLESHLEARLWNDIFIMAQQELGLPRGTIKATVLIETILGAFEMEEILYELREHSAGLNCGRWDYIFSVIKKFSNKPEFVMPDRAQVTMTTHFLRHYSLLAIQTCHKRGAHAIGGMAAQIPIKNDPVANDAAIAKVTADKVREAGDGHDGTWVAHPGLVPVAQKVFDEKMPQPNQLNRLREDVKVTASDLLQVPTGTITEGGLRTNLNVGVLYLEAWLRGLGCVPLYNLMEDAATSEISRAQVWQWIRHGAKLDDGRTVTAELAQSMLDDELVKVRQTMGDKNYSNGKFDVARKIFKELMTSKEFVQFLTIPAYEIID
ncbi:MAG: malate synthase A [Acidobacteria bacterium RIFCSPLOWO2_12_FULL_54_10]|nr:MAG: malate synthase A [Acidobacteria bacterium RIFCSPLOWO2_12_FULL_54_10]